MLSTSVYGFERDIVQICALLKELGYNVVEHLFRRICNSPTVRKEFVIRKQQMKNSRINQMLTVSR